MNLYTSMNYLVYSIGLASLVLSEPLSHSIKFVEGLNNRLNQFGICNIRITAEFNNTEFEPFHASVTLVDVKHRKNLSLIEHVWQPYNSRNLTHVLHNKYRAQICTLDLILHLGLQAYIEDSHLNLYPTNEYMADKYFVIIRQHALFLMENHTSVWEKGYIKPTDHRIFIWTLKRSNSWNLKVLRYHFVDIFFMYLLQNVGITPRTTSIYCVPLAISLQEPEFSLDIHVNAFAAKVRKDMSWRNRSEINYTKLSRGTNLPFDERNLNREPSKHFYIFVQDLLNRANLTTLWHVYSIGFGPGGGSNDPWLENTVPDETDGFNFITCVTFDTIWSIAKLFQQPYQPLVWAGLGVVLIKIQILWTNVQSLSLGSVFHNYFIQFN